MAKETPRDELTRLGIRADQCVWKPKKGEAPCPKTGHAKYDGTCKDHYNVPDGEVS